MILGHLREYGGRHGCLGLRLRDHLRLRHSHPRHGDLALLLLPPLGVDLRRLHFGKLMHDGPRLGQRDRVRKFDFGRRQRLVGEDRLRPFELLLNRAFGRHARHKEYGQNDPAPGCWDPMGSPSKCGFVEIDSQSAFFGEDTCCNCFG